MATYEIRSLSTIIRKGGVKRFEVVERGEVKILTQLKRGAESVIGCSFQIYILPPPPQPWRYIMTGPLNT